ncbi:odorant receptor 185 [Diachasma alloeum]|uniref:Odorant receptor n=2 Tax=Diachasma alloeum TaxID=454923 RepID=A0A4E0S4J6_9HYME|nr:odorant receptor 185 [Diachasma alloeum]
MFAVSNSLLEKLCLRSIYGVFHDTSVTEEENVLLFSVTAAAALLVILGFISNFIHEWNLDMHRALETMPMIFSTILAWFGGVSLCRSKEGMKGLLENMKTAWTKELKEGVDDKIINTAKRSILFTVFYAILICAVGAFYLIVPFVRAVHKFVTDEDQTHFDFNMRLLPIRYPFSIDTVPMYILCTIFEVVCTFFFINSYLSVDTLFLQLTTILSLLLQIVGKKYAEITLYNDVRKLNCGLLKKLHNMGRQHSELLSYCERIEEIFNPIIFLIIIFTSAHLCVCVFALESKLSVLQFVDAATLLFHFVAIIMQPFIYCNSAEDISHWTNNIANTIYTCQWPDQSQKFRKIVLLTMIRSHRDYKFKAYGLYKVNRYLLTQLVHTAFNFFMLLRKTNNSLNI